MPRTDPSPDLPRPFCESPWPAALRPAARALWDWHLALEQADASAVPAERLHAFFEAERGHAAAGERLRLVPDEVADAAYDACAAHGLPRELLARQVEGARRLQGTVRFPASADVGAFLSRWAHPHARLLARLADVTGSWQLPRVDEMATAFFWVGRLAYLARDLERDRLFIPVDDLDQAGVTVEELRRGRLDEDVRRLLWKQVVRARDAFAQGGDLIRELPGRYARAGRRWWLGGLEVLNEIQRREYDVWTRPVVLSRRHRIQVLFQAQFGRTTFR